MRSLKLTLRRDDAGAHSVHSGPGADQDLLVRVDPDATVGALAEALAQRDPAQARRWPTVTLMLAEPSGPRPLSVDTKVERSGLRSGSVVWLAPAGVRAADPHAHAEVGVVEVLDGPDAGRRFRLGSGENLVGRHPQSTVALTDQSVSMRHAKIVISDVVEIVDTDSTNGVVVGGGLVNRARLRPGDTAMLGDTLIRVDVHANLGGPQETTRPNGQQVRTVVPFNRSPRLAPVYPGVELEGPEPPQRPSVRRFPLLPMLAPILMGGLLYLLTHQVFSLVFIALSPLMLVGTYLEDAMANRRAFKASTIEYRTALSELNAAMHRGADTERAARQQEHPSTWDLLQAAATRSPLLWTRRPEHESILELRLGLGRQPSRNSVKMPARNGTTAALWKELTEIAARYRYVEPVPIVARLTQSGALGVAGGSERALAVARGLVTQLVALHSPAELVLAGVMSSQSAQRWDWLKWLPHTSPAPDSPHTPLRSDPLATDGASAVNLIAEIDDLINQRAEQRQDANALPRVVLLVADDTAADRGLLVSIAERGPERGVYVIWVAARTADLPAVCRTFIDVDGEAEAGTAGFVRTGDQVDPVELEPVSATDAAEFARRLAPLVDAGARVDDDSSLPRSVSFLDLVQAAVDRSEQSVVDRWEESGSLGRAVGGAGREGHLRALIGASGPGADDALRLDLRADGPHALVGGTTGAGKSELLQAWILALATTYSPQRVTFLLVDYKGGSAFGDCNDLPHSVGLVTDLTPKLVQRALTSLRAELTYREEFLHRYGAKDLSTLEARGTEGAPPRLVIVVDEFAALKKEVPEFVDGVIDVAQRGRSLGLHLILATQRPTGVITENLKANVNLRIALRMADEGDSTDVIGSAAAAGFDPGIPGRAVAKTGPGRAVTFQTAYVGGWTRDEPAPPTIAIQTLAFGPGQVWAARQAAASAEPEDPGPSDITRIADNIGKAFRRTRLPRPRRPWRDELESPLELGGLLREGPVELADLIKERQESDARLGRAPSGPSLWEPAVIYGREDIPREQVQPPVVFLPDQKGNLVVYGAGGSGKSTLLRTLAIAAVHGSIGPTHVYGIDFGSLGLSMLEALPQVGSIVNGDDAESVGRLLDLCRQHIDRRVVEMDAVRANTLPDLWDRRGRSGDNPDWEYPRILLLLDGIGAFAQRYQPGSVSGVYERLLHIAAQGRRAGVHVVVTADRTGAVPSGLVSSLQEQVVLRLATDNDYRMMGLAPDAIDRDAPPGRGRLGKNEIQVAVFGGPDPVAQHTAIADLAARTAGLPAAPTVGTLRSEVRLSELADVVGEDEPALGLAGNTLAAVGFPSRGTFVITGPAGSGRPEALATVLASYHRWHDRAQFVYIGQSHSRLAGWPRWAARATDLAQATEVAEKLLPHALPVSRTRRGEGEIVLVLEGLPEYAVPAVGADHPLLRLVLELAKLGHLVVAEGDVTQMATSHGLVQAVRRGRTGLVLRPEGGYANILGPAFPRGLNPNDFPPGRGLLVAHEQVTVVQVAIPDVG
jgi:S-DNA-T family DNA segregation ATPase FtsK/SpoIIIE